MGAMNELINVDAVRLLVQKLRCAAPARNFEALTAIESGQLDPLNLRARSDLVSRRLLDDLPTRYESAAAIIRSALQDPSFAGWAIWPVTEAVATLAITAGRPDAFDDGLTLLSELTPRLTAEFAIRRFLEADLTRTLSIAQAWTRHPDASVRRLASEGTRPRLPWAIRVRGILEAPGCTTAILDALHEDSSEYVRRSVSNHLNDISHDSPDVALALAARWLQTPGPNTHATVRRGLRTLVKAADSSALSLMGFTPAPLKVSELILTDTQVIAPGSIDFAFTVTNEGAAPAQVAVDYVVHFLRHSGGYTEKVFKLTTRTIPPGGVVRLRKSHSFRPLTTRAHYAGTHALQVQVNGLRSERAEFSLAIVD